MYTKPNGILVSQKTFKAYKNNELLGEEEIYSGGGGSINIKGEKEEIVPLSLDEAKEVAAFILDGNGYMKIFGIVEE